MTDVAKLAGVSHQTVSRVINGSPQVRPATRERVLAAMRELDYRPNSAARALVTGRSQTLGVVSFDTTLYGPASTLYAIERAAHDAGYFIMTVSLEALDRDSVLSAVDRLRLQGVDGILVIAPLEGAGEALVDLPRGLPLVAVEAGPAEALPVVAVDQFAGARARHPAPARARPPDGRAHRRAARLPRGRAAHRRLARRRSSRGRRRGRRRCWSATGARARATSSARRLLRDGARRARSSSPTTRWRSARCARCTRPGDEIPRQVSVVGFDDIPEAQYFTPPLTTVRQDFAEIGRRSLRLMLEMMDVAATRGRRRRRWWRRS